MLDIAYRSDHHIRKKRPPNQLPNSILFDDFRDVINDASLDERLPLKRPNTNNWQLESGIFVGNNGKAEARFPGTSPSILRFDLGRADVEISLIFRFPSTGNNRSAGVVSRFTDTNNYFYTLANMDNQIFRLLDRTGGSVTLLDEVAFNFQADVDYVMKFTAVGDRFFSEIEGIGTLNATSSIRLTATSHGIRSTNEQNQGAVLFDSFKIVEPAPIADVFVTTTDTLIGNSNYISSIALVHNDDLRIGGNDVARQRAMNYLSQAFSLHRIAMCGSFGGPVDPFNYIGSGGAPDGSGPYPDLDEATVGVNDLGLGGLDNIVTWVKSMGHEPIMTFYNTPWWTRGRWFGGTNTTPLQYPQDQFSDDGRPYTERWKYCRILTRVVARRYLRPPHNIRWWCTGYEFHGFERARDGGFSTLGYDLYPGTPGVADMGKAFGHNEMINILLEEAAAIGLTREDLFILPDYPRMRTRGVANSGCYAPGHPMRDQVWGSVEKFGPETLFAWLPLLEHYDYWTYDVGSLNNGDQVHITDYVTNLQKFPDIHAWLVSELASRGVTVPGMSLETYIKPWGDVGTGQEQYRGMFYAKTLGDMVREGAASVQVWSSRGHAHEPGAEHESGMHTSIATSTGGQKLPAYDAVKIYHDLFSAGTPMYVADIVGSGVDAHVNPDKVVVVNYTDQEKTVNVNNTVYTFSPNEFRVVNK